MRKKLQGSHALKEDLAHFDREEFKAGSTEYTCAYLLESMDRHLRRHGQDRNQHQFERKLQTEIEALTSGKKLSAAALNKVMNATPGKGGGKGDKCGTGAGTGSGKGGAGKGKGAGDQQCWYHNASHYDPTGGKGCTAAIDPATGKTTCRYLHTFMSREKWDSLNQGKGNAAPAWNPKGKCKGKGKGKYKGKGKGKCKDTWYISIAGSQADVV